jgi:arabinose-5-phosphate isomerase
MDSERRPRAASSGPRPAAGPDDLAVGRRLLLAEAAGLAAVAHAIDGAFVRALDAMQEARGRVVVSGMGKSGHIARKIAATLASTGTPAQYINAAEASHGDLGMITVGDVVLVLSYSGETAELSDLVAYTRLRGVKLIAMSGKAQSTLAKAADIALILPPISEACPLSLAPTTSTTAMLALGDALAIALLERRGFSAEEFGMLHPGGQLGRRFIKVTDIMHGGSAVPLVAADTGMSDALLVMTEKAFGCVGITDGAGRLIGVITDGDLRRHMEPTLLQRCVRDVMTPSPKTVDPDLLAAAALRMMNEGKITALFVVEGHVPIGIVKIHDLLRAGLVDEPRR